MIRRPPSVDELITDDGEPMESQRHCDQMLHLIESLKLAWRDRDDFYTAGNMFLYFSETQSKNNDFRGPDFFVVLNTTNRERKAWVVWEENGQTPDVVVELLSDSTRHVDKTDKKRIYGRVLRVPEYFWFDPHSGEFAGFTLNVQTSEYEPKKPNAKGWLRSDRLGMFLGKVPGTLGGVTADWLRLIQDDGTVAPVGLEIAQLADEASARADEASARADEASARADEAQRELARLRAKLAEAGVDPDD